MSKLKILHINTFDRIGGASQAAMDLVHHLDADCSLAVKHKYSDDPKVIPIGNYFSDHVFLFLEKTSWKLGFKKPFRSMFGIENEWNFTYNKLKKLKEYREADVIHLHNLHGGYFDLHALKKIAREKKIVWTLHDMWAFTGGEAYTFDNENYKKGIGYTPYGANYPMLNPIIDRRQHFIELKKKLYADCHDSIAFVTVSKWLENCFSSAFTFNKQLNLSTIYGGFDSTIFFNEGQRTWRKPRILLFNLLNSYPFKGSWLFINSIERINLPFDLFVVGEKIKSEIPVTHFNYLDDRKSLCNLYNSVDILIFPSVAESFGLTALEAMACGVCVVSSDAGGIPELTDNNSGFVFSSGYQDDLTEKVNLALNNLELSRSKGFQASEKVKQNFTLDKTCEQYMSLYRTILKKKQ